MHGVQGDTADASVVGPDVDAAGLYVGLTRGRLSNVAVVVVRTDAAARECLGESMQRWTPELTMQDAVRAAEAEIRRAERNREASMDTGPVVGARVRPAGEGCSTRLLRWRTVHRTDDHTTFMWQESTGIPLHHRSAW